MQFIVHTLSRITDGITAMTISTKGIVIEGKHGKKLYTWQMQLQPPRILEGKITPKLQIWMPEGRIKVRIRQGDRAIAQFELQKLWLNAHITKLRNSIAKLESLLERRYLSHALLKTAKGMAQELAGHWLTWPLDQRLEAYLAQSRYTLEEVHTWQPQDIEDFREAFIAKQLLDYETFFDGVAGQPLTVAQRRACVVVDERQLLLAGAGTGKTSVMIAKAGYLSAAGIAEASQILMLAYGKEAANEMQSRLRQANLSVECRTFHSLGIHILTVVEGKTPKLSQLSNDERQRRQFILETLQSLCQDRTFNRNLLDLLKRNFKADKDSADIDFSSPNMSRLVKQFSELIGMFKQSRSLGSLQQVEAEFEHYLAVFRPVLSEYQLYLNNEQAIDYEDMISCATKYVKNSKFESSWVHILVDEFQDISPARAELVRAILAQHRRSHLFAVGDDWQSIYRFSGADLSLTTHFSQHFGPSTVMQLDKTFRYPQDLLNLASNFVCQNPQQIVKQVRAQVVSDVPSLVIEAQNQDDALHTKLSELEMFAPSNSSVMILARYHKQLPPQGQLTQLASRFNSLTIRAMTFHAAKGKEADYTILIGLDTSVPSNQNTDSIIEAFLAPLEAFPHAEERRLFYVALTRAKKQTYILSPQQPSRFITEIAELM
ncbi:UvrD-helicase domain-containing protein [Pseudoalteromonas sp. SMS1]|uniref:UvrD-helicase domain-containing protein n=1 Tax=Pseudoalteromonas sp. SMS1 TaxID=2908894 RepID=UPI001F240880|nr:UvrD-helicase domain-containing protein [Pseudoalteromonas sp. SMS1]MCF2856232.1 UvrD-helicase domain-containing protein [Pseudoalteromonas sp. SMS1]